MINSNYNNLYYGYLNAVDQNNRAKNVTGQKGNAGSKTTAKKADSAPTSPRYESLDKALSKGKSRGTTTNMDEIAEKTNAATRRSESKSAADGTDARSVFSRMRDMQLAMYGGGTSTYKNAMGSLLNNMVFSPMSSSKDLFMPSFSTGTLRAALNAVYDTSDVEARIQESAANGKGAADTVQNES